jgi:hypothetical protein
LQISSYDVDPFNTFRVALAMWPNFNTSSGATRTAKDGSFSIRVQRVDGVNLSNW